MPKRSLAPEPVRTKNLSVLHDTVSLILETALAAHGMQEVEINGCEGSAAPY